MTGIGVLSLAGLAARYAAGRGRSGWAWPVLVESRLGDIGEVDEVSVLPLVERLTPDGAGAGALRGEPGVSYLARAGGTRLLFDTRLSGGRARSALVAIAERLGVDLSALDAVVISHLHEDHVGGFRAMTRRTFAFAAEPSEPRGARQVVALPDTERDAEGPTPGMLPSPERRLRQARLEGPAGLQLTLFTGRADPGTSE